VASISVFGVTTVLPLANGLGCETCGVSLIWTVRFPCVTATVEIWGIMHLTYFADSNSCGSASLDIGEAGAPADEIEITPEMVKAGEKVLWLGCVGDEAAAAQAVFKEMWLVINKMKDP
jgi:hypothetical protein